MRDNDIFTMLLGGLLCFYIVFIAIPNNSQTNTQLQILTSVFQLQFGNQSTTQAMQIAAYPGLIKQHDQDAQDVANYKDIANKPWLLVNLSLCFLVLVFGLMNGAWFGEENNKKRIQDIQAEKSLKIAEAEKATQDTVFLWKQKQDELQKKYDALVLMKASRKKTKKN